MNIKELKAIFFDFGHGYQGDQGAVANGTTERKELLELAEDIQKYWVQIKEFKNIPVYYMGLGNSPDSLKDRIRKINSICRSEGYNRQNSILISCHMNAGGGRGVESWYETGKLDSSDLGNLISQQVATTAGIPKRITRPDGQNRLGRLGVLRDTIPVSTLVELCFLDNRIDVDILKDPVKDDLFARGVLRGLKKYLGVL